MVIAGTVLEVGEPDEPRPWEAWGPGARARLAGAVAELERFVERDGVEILLAPSASGVVSDVPSVLQFAREHGGKRVGLVIEPAAMLTGSMMGTVEDHLERLYGLAGLDVVRMVVVSGVREGAGGLEPCDVGEGILDERLIQEAVRRVGRAGLKWAVRGEGSGVERWIKEKARV